MQLKEKTWYERRDGKSALCHVRAKGDKHDFPWAVECNGSMETYNDDGSYSNQPNSQMDLIREIGPTLEEKPKKEMDREKVWSLYYENISQTGFPNKISECSDLLDEAISAYKVFAERFK